MRLFNFKIRLNKRLIKSHLSDEKFTIIEAFTLNGKRYFMYEDSTKIPSGRGLSALAIYEEMNQRCTRDMLKDFVRAFEIVMNSNPVKLTVLAQLVSTLKERLDMAVMPDYVYKLASVIFFDETESPISYDYQYNNKKIEEWKATGGSLDFFMKTPLRDLIPALQLQGQSAETYFQVAEMVDSLHHTNLQDILSSQA